VSNGRMKVVVFVMVAAVLSLCVWAIAGNVGGEAEAASAAVRYQITAGDGATAWMVDSATGRVWLCEDGGCREMAVANLHPRPGR
jgi:hypothetical protein